MKHLSLQRQSVKALTLIATTATVAATMGPTAIAQADDSDAFRSPSGNIGCKMGTGGVMCEISSITCDSEPSGMTCTDSGTGHFFRVSRDSYQLG